ncbi:MAG: exonuclease domain-containing protein, partial [Chloroflexota bacterium]|nr:exonuclease domain-containing protein [Chloroflexota bacterium]
VSPQRPIPHKVTQLTGIIQEELEGAPAIHSLISPLRRFLGTYPIVGHSISFDLEFLSRCGLFLDNALIDTFKLAGILMPHAARYSLGTLADELGIEFPIRHRALADAMASKELLLALMERARRLPLGTIREINRLAANTDWPLRQVFQDVEREQARSAFTGSIGQQLMAKRGLGVQGSMELLFVEKERKRPLQPAPQRKPLDVDALAAMLEEGGLFAEHFPGYEHRPQQVKMLRAVAEAFNQGQHLLVEAGTGIGKSLAYLLPAIHFAVQNGEHVAISTNTINLQDQLYNKDIPDIKRILPLNFEAVLLKGRTNYICLRRLAALRHKGHLSPDEMQVLAKVLVWLPSTVTGDREELFLPSAKERAIWGALCAESESCLPERCRYFREGKCFFYRARHRAESAHLIVVNHALLLSDIAVENRVLPDYRYLIVDEAHHLEDATTQQLSFKVDCQGADKLLGGLSQNLAPGHYTGFLATLLARCLPALPGDSGQKLKHHVEKLQQEAEKARHRLYEFFNALDAFVGEYRREESPYDQRIRLTSGLRVQPAWDGVAITWDNLSLPLLELGKGLEELAGGVEELTDYEIPDVEDMLQELIGYSHRTEELWEQTNALIAEPSPKGIYWITVGAQDGSISLHAAPLHVGELVQRHLFMPKECVILTSATLCTGGNFDYIRERLNAW